MKEYTNFSFHMHTHIVFGKGVEAETAKLVKKYGGTKVMLVYGGGSIKKTGLYDSLVDQLRLEKIPFVELGGVQPNPRRSLVDKGLRYAIDEKVDFLLGVGGGSAIDTAKAIALGLANDGNYWQFYTGTKAEKIAHVGVVLTIAAAGSETSGSSVLLDDIGDNRKHGFLYDTCRPVFAVMNPELTYTVPVYQVAAGAADIFAHTLGRYFTRSFSYLGDKYCEATLKTVVKYAPVALENPTDYEARAELMLAGSFSHNDLTSIGRADPSYGGEHALEGQLSGTFDTAHGAGIALVMPAWLQYITENGISEQVARVAQLATNVFDVSPDSNNNQAVALEGLKRFRQWIKRIGMPLTLKEMGIDERELPGIVSRCDSDSTGILRGYVDLDKNAVESIFTSVI